jgi:hypothetical protein
MAITVLTVTFITMFLALTRTTSQTADTTGITGSLAAMVAFSIRMERLTLTAAAGETMVRMAGRTAITE